MSSEEFVVAGLAQPPVLKRRGVEVRGRGEEQTAASALSFLPHRRGIGLHLLSN